LKKGKSRSEKSKNRDLTTSLTQKEAERLGRFRAFQQELAQKYGQFPEPIQEVTVPTSIFSPEIGALEAICRYLKKQHYRNKEIAVLIGRSEKNIWQTLNQSNKKRPMPINTFPTRFFIPLSILKNDKLSVLENIIQFFQQKFELSIQEIAALLHRNESTIHTITQRIKQKEERDK
jgi:hypothetical protein